jgi:ParB-like chromosome segregation protein Spo0J
MTTTSSVARVDLDPRDLLVDVNIRTDARLDKDFVASIKDFGVLVPITAVRTAGGEVRVRFGHRRTLAAIAADLATVPVEIIGDEAVDDAGQIERILTQHAENEHRKELSDMSASVSSNSLMRSACRPHRSPSAQRSSATQ